jgi:hypothetical protein
VTAIAPTGNTSLPLPRAVWIGLLLLLAGGFLTFWFQTIPVRLATSDDVLFQQVAREGHAAEYLADIARQQGRFLYCTPIYRFALFFPYLVQAPWLFSLLRTAAFYMQIALAATLAARVMRSTAFGALVALLLAGTLHIPDTFFLLLSFPPAWIGFAALLGALHCHLTFVRQPGLLSGLLAGVFYLLAALMHDVFIVFLPLFFVLSCLQGKPQVLRLLRQNLIPLAVALAYVAVYRGFAREFPSSYEGTQFSLDVPLAAKVLLRQLVGIVPGFELVVHRVPADTTGPLFRPLADIGQTLGALPAPCWLLALGFSAMAAWLCGLCLRAPRPQAWPWLLALGFACLANLPIALSVKYQVFILHREFPYGYACLSFYFAVVATVGALLWFAGFLPEAGRRRLPLACGGVTLACCVSALASNQRILQILLAKYN